MSPRPVSCSAESLASSARAVRSAFPPSPLPRSSSSSVSLKKMVSNTLLSRSRSQRRSKEQHSNHEAHFSISVRRHIRQGYVGVQRDSLRSWAWTRRMWMVLDDGWLHICPREGAEAACSLSLGQVCLVERINSRRFCIGVAAASQTWYLIFKDIVSLNDWWYDIRLRCPLLHIGLPTGVRHELHVSYDAAAGEITGLPEQWIEVLSSWGVGPNLTTAYSRPPSPDVTTPLTAPDSHTMPGRPSVSDDSHRPLPPAPVERLLAPLQRSVSNPSTPSRAPSMVASVVTSVEQFRRSPHRFRDVDARDLTGVIRRLDTLPASRDENSDYWKAEWTGSFGTRKVAVQAILLPGTVSDRDRNQLASIVLREVKALHQLRHPNVVRTRGFAKDQGPLPGIITTWLPRGNLMTYLRNQRPVVERKERLFFLNEIASGLNYLHNFSRTIVHGNIRGSHILLSDRGNACLSGFGINPILEAIDSVTDNATGTMSVPPSPRWAAIEVIQSGRRKFTPASDVFSFARTVVEVMTGKDPFHYIADENEVVHTVLRGILPRRPIVFGEDGLWQFLERCWQEDPAQRPSMAMALLRMEELLAPYQSQEPEVIN